jgi:protein gp37
MSETTKIEWADATFNPWIGCTRVGPGCDNCYAAVSTPSRSMSIKWGAGEPRHHTSASNWAQPLVWERKAQDFQAEHGRRQRVFCASLADVFDNEVPPSWRAELFALIASTPNLDWMLLTKRIGNVAKMIEAPGMQKCGLPGNVWLGATVVNQEEADRDIPKLLAVPARVRFLSIEPMLGPIFLTNLHVGLGTPLHNLGVLPPSHDHIDGLRFLRGIDWVICGGESGPGARPIHPDWARSLRDQCAAAGVPFLFKQWGCWAPGSSFADRIPSGECCDFDGSLKGDDERVWKVKKQEAGRLLDGREHNDFPTPKEHA